MELQWNKSSCPYLQMQMHQTQNLEETTELRLSEEMPDISHVVGAWGQCIIRSKQWRSDGMVISGGVTASVLYQPEDGMPVRYIETWIPFQTKWNLPQSRRECAMRVSSLLTHVDARMLSSRKMMVRVGIGLNGEVLEPTQTDICYPDQIPDHVQVLTNVYPAVIPREAGEKQFNVEEEVIRSGTSQWVSFTFDPEVTEQNVVGNRLVIRGLGTLRYVYLDEEGTPGFGTRQIPFAQFADLEHDYENDTTADVVLCVSGLEQEASAEGVRVTCSITAQYLLKERMLLEIAEDAYCPSRELSVSVQMLKLPMELDSRQELLEAMVPMPHDSILETRFLPEQPRTYREGNLLHLEMPAQFQWITRDGEGNLNCITENWTGKLEIPGAENTKIRATVHGVEVSSSGATVTLNVQTWVDSELPMICDITAGEEQTLPQDRPSLLLRPMDGDSLWDFAKRTGSTMDAIRKANHLTQEPQPGQMLLIPLL